MWKLFSTDHLIGRALTRAVDLVILNVVYLIFCLPVVTAGAATSALYYVTSRMADGTFVQPVRDFWRGFRDNFRAVTPVWLIALLYGAVVGVEIWMNRRRVWGEGHALWIYAALIAVTALLVLFCEWVFALQMRFENPRRVLLKNAALFTVRYLPSLLVIDVLNVLFLLLIFSDMTFWPVSFICGFSVPALLKGYYFSRIFNRLIAILRPDALPADPAEDEARALARTEDQKNG